MPPTTMATTSVHSTRASLGGEDSPSRVDRGGDREESPDGSG